MFVPIVLILSLLYAPSSGQNTTAVSQPTLGQVYPSSINASVLNFTYSYPANYQFAQLNVSFTIYDFNNTNGSFTTYPFSTLTFTNNNYSLPWAAPPYSFQAGDYIIACFEWTRADANGTVLSDDYQCTVTRAPINSAIPAIASPSASMSAVNSTTASLWTYFPRELPYDILSVTVLLNNMTYPSTLNQSSNNTYSFIYTFAFANLTSNTNYSACAQYNYGNSQINGTNQTYSQCLSFQTTSTTSPTGSSTRTVSSLLSMILLFLMTCI